MEKMPKVGMKSNFHAAQKVLKAAMHMDAKKMAQ
jgi:hypothetical protein